MWIGTERGLNRFNGYDYHQYLHSSDSTTIPDNRIYDICADNKGRIWVGTEDGVALYTEDDRFERIPVGSDERAALQILCDRQGRIILNMQEDLCVYDSLSRSFVKAVPGFDRFYNYHSVCHLGNDGALWVVATREIRCFDPSADFYNIDNWPCLHIVTESLMMSDGRILMAGSGVFSLFDTRTRRFLAPPAPLSLLSGLEVRKLWETVNSGILICTSDGKYHFLNPEMDELKDIPASSLGLPDGFVTKAVYKDRVGDIWLGSDDKGFVFCPRFLLDEPGSPGLRFEGKSVTSMSTAPDGRLWVFSRHDGLFLYDSLTGTYEHPDLSGIQGGSVDYLQTNDPMVFAASNGDLWLAFPDQQRLVCCTYSGGKMKLKGEYEAFYPKVAIEDGDGGIWIGTRNEFLMHFPPGGMGFERVQIFPFRTTFINCLAFVDGGILVGAYDNDLALYDVRSRQVRRVTVSGEGASAMGSGLFDPESIYADSSGRVWVGTRFGGLLRYDQDARELYPIPGSSGREFFSIEEDVKGRLWAGTGEGLVVFDPSTMSFTDYLPQRDDGSHSYHVRSSARLPGGMLAFGCSQGLTVVDPLEEPVHATLSPVFEDLKIHNTLVRPGDGRIGSSLASRPEITLDYRSNAFSISFAVPDFRYQGRIRYSYMLEGFEKGWVETGSSHEAYFSNVPAGRYRLRVRYFIQPRGEEYIENSIMVRIRPAPWASAPAVVLYIAITILLAWLAVRVRRRLRKEKEAVREAELAKDQEARINRLNMKFFANVSHEFRTPLTMIYGPVSELARSGRLASEDLHLVGIVRKSVARMLSLVDQILDLGKLENSSLSLKVSYSNVVPVLKDTVELFRVNANSLGIKMIIKGMEFPLHIWFDSDKVEKILTNLLSNALKFTPAGGTVSVELDELYREGRHLVSLTVSDTGPGIPEEEREKIFDRYYQLENNQGRYNAGTGIGLYYSRSLAAIHHGELNVGPRDPGPGAVFTLLIPAERESYKDSEISEEGGRLSEGYPVDTIVDEMEEVEGAAETKPMLLAVDDDPDVVRYLTALFSSQFKVLAAYNADEALKLALEQSPDIVLSDVAMPGKTGFDLCSELKSNIQLCHIPVILVTAMGTVQQQVRGLDQGADAYVTKPFDPDYLKALVKSQLENRQRARNLLSVATHTGEVDSLSSRDRAFMDELYSLMEAELANEELDISGLTQMLRMSRTKFYYKIKGLTGKTPSEFFMQYKLNTAAKLLLEGKLNVSEIAMKTGFSTLPHFSKAFKKQFGVSPSKYEG